jgi:hypothetical protein
LAILYYRSCEVVNFICDISRVESWNFEEKAVEWPIRAMS